jgi:hypothetical protein
VAIISIAASLPFKEEQAYHILVNFLNILLGLIILSDFLYNLHFIVNKTIRYNYLVSHLFYTFESVLALLSSSSTAFRTYVDLDYLTLILFFFTLKLFLAAYNKMEDRIETQFVYSISNSLDAQ